jgi:protein involved in polysaccharide export with SLBB domain
MTVGASYVHRTAFMLKATFGIVLAAAVLSGCAAANNSAEHSDQIASASTPRKDVCPPEAMLAAQEAEKGIYVIRPGDELQLDFYLNPEFNRTVAVRPDGDINLDLVGKISAAGETPEQLAEKLNQAYLRELRNPGAVVHIKNSPTWRVYVQGQVAHAGVFTLQPGETAMQAIAEAGGVTEDAGAADAVLIRRDACGNARGQKLDMRGAESGKKVDDVALMPSDIVVVPRSPIADLDLFVKHYIKNLLPIDTYMPLPL